MTIYGICLAIGLLGGLSGPPLAGTSGTRDAGEAVSADLAGIGSTLGDPAQDVTRLQDLALELEAQNKALRADLAAQKAFYEARLAVEREVSDARDNLRSECETARAASGADVDRLRALVDTLSAVREQEVRSGFWRSVRAGFKAGLVGTGLGYAGCEASQP